ncbi:hypothetical protein SODALDRAFT_301693 [Sodiomyces alkalinus F11]|uniref:Uncharacterized protein n=1 Tax=Sodiomyces alkalinus (strain CBS 110278 / VKM F-3762 / F11) TaxID=1314773 RepID=A0A3N2PKN7_SODAK|nr:hypothetical protein SODALDRAFT_301693 [Sodiomyces alkalinus F11]ROT35088.1 hypothetical protein SODALDRAFT_301693 [Sodiomyces alkalinus F11]
MPPDMQSEESSDVDINSTPESAVSATPATSSPEATTPTQAPPSPSRSPTPSPSPPRSLPTCRPSPSRPRRCARRRVYRAEEGSLYDLMRQNAGESLFVRPLCWTDLHSRVLGIRFVEKPADDVPHVAQGSHKASPRAQRLCEELTRLEFPEFGRMYATDHIREVIETLYPASRLTSAPPRDMMDLPLYFGGRPYPNVCRVQLAWNCLPLDGGEAAVDSFRTVSTCPADPALSGMTGSQPAAAQRHPTVAYMSRRFIYGSRSAMFRIAPAPGGSMNVPVESLCALRINRLVPSVRDEEAIFGAVFLAMAQARFYPNVPLVWRRNHALRTPPSSPETAPEFHDVKVHLVTNDDAGGHFTVYTAVVTAAFLQRFHEPTKAPRPRGGAAAGGEAATTPELDRGMRIEYTRVPFWPVLGLKERLGKALGRDLVGDFDEQNIDMLGSRKRKWTDMSFQREILAQRVNGGGFDDEGEETSSDEPVSEDPKGVGGNPARRRRRDAVNEEDGDTESPTPPKKARRDGPRYDAEASRPGERGEVPASILA